MSLFRVRAPSKELLPGGLAFGYSVAHWCHHQTEQEEKMGTFFHYFQMWISATFINKLNFSDDFLGYLVELGLEVMSLIYRDHFPLYETLKTKCAVYIEESRFIVKQACS